MCPDMQSLIIVDIFNLITKQQEYLTAQYKRMSILKLRQV